MFSFNGLIPLTNTDNKLEEEKDISEDTSMPTQNRIDHSDQDQNFVESLKFFRILLWYAYSSTYNWKSLAASIYHIEHLINHLDNYQIKDSIQKSFRNILDYFILFMKDLITRQMQSSKRNDISGSSILQKTPVEIKVHIEKLQTDFIHLKDLILTTKERLNLCKTDLDALEIILQAIEKINFDSRIFDRQDQEKIRFLSLKNDLTNKPTKTDLMQMKIYIDNQMKKILELNKENAQELERIKLLKTSTCQTRHIQSILSTNSSSRSKQFHRNYSYQTSRPYITFELDQIRKYQRQALVQSPYGTIPLYRRQAWAAANLFPNHSLHFLRHLQSSLRMQIHDLLGYDPSNICNVNKKKKPARNSTVEIFHRNDEVLIMGNNNRLYRGRIDSCEITSVKKGQEKKSQMKKNIEEKNEIHFDQFDRSNERIFDEHLFEYLDWQIQFNEQDLPDELCEELFHHWTSIICNDQPCHCEPESKFKSIQIPSEFSSVDDIYDDRCMCSECSCSCEKYQDDQLICLCSQCSCQYLRDSTDEYQETIENHSEKDLENDVKSEEEEEEAEIPADDQPAVIEEKEIMACDCFLNQTDRWTEQFDLSPKQSHPFPLENDIPLVFNALELDDPTAFRQQILNHSSI